MRKFLRMIPVLVLACALLSVSAFAEDSVCTDHTWEDGVCIVCGYECPHDSGWEQNLDEAYHNCPVCYAEIECVDMDNDYYCDVCGQYLDVLAAGGCLHMLRDDGRVVTLFTDVDHYWYCLDCDIIISLSGYYGSMFPAEYYYHTDEDCFFCSIGLESLPYRYLDVFRCPVLLSVVSGEGVPDSSTFIVCYDDVGHYLGCLDCGAYLEIVLLGFDDNAHTDDNCTACKVFSSTSSCVGVMSLSDFSASFDSSASISTLVDDTTSIFSGYLDMAAVTANTVSEHPVLLVAFALPLIGVAVVLFRRIRR